MRRSVSIDPGEVVALVGAGPTALDEVSNAVLDAAAALYATHGVRRVSVDDIAEASGVGRTTIYRRFDGRQQILEAVLGREVRRFFASLIGPSAHLDRFDDIVVESFLNGLLATDATLLATLARTEPELLALLTVDGAAVLDAGRHYLVSLYEAIFDDRPAHLELTLETLLRLALSFTLTPSATLPIDDIERCRDALHHLLDPLLASLACVRPS